MARSRQRVNLQRAKAMRRHGDLPGAERACRQALRRNPRSEKALRTLAAILGKTGRADEAITCLRKALAIRPDRSDVRLELARTCWKEGQRDEAAIWFRAAADVNPASAECHVRLAEMQASQINYRAAIEILEAALDFVTLSERSSIEHPLADSYLASGRYSEAIAMYGRLVMRAMPKSREARIRVRRATAMRKAGQFDRAMVEYDRALELRPGLPEAVAGKAEILES